MSWNVPNRLLFRPSPEGAGPGACVTPSLGFQGPCPLVLADVGPHAMALSSLMLTVISYILTL